MISSSSKTTSCFLTNFFSLSDRSDIILEIDGVIGYSILAANITLVATYRGKFNAVIFLYYKDKTLSKILIAKKRVSSL
jgi:hypothetical protein